MWRTISKHSPTVVGVLFLYSGLYKLIHPGGATAALLALDLGFSLAVATTIGVTILELYLGAILLLKIDLKWGLSLAIGLMLVFASFLFYLSTMANPPACGCMGLTQIFRSNRHDAIFGLMRNCLLIWLLKGAFDYYCRGQALLAPGNRAGAA